MIGCQQTAALIVDIAPGYGYGRFGDVADVGFVVVPFGVDVQTEQSENDGCKADKQQALYGQDPPAMAFTHGANPVCCAGGIAGPS